MCQSFEYCDIIEKACELKGPENKALRLAYIGAFQATSLTNIEKNANKPFNPLLGETFEFENEQFEFLAEQVLHHPPVTASICRGKRANFKGYTNSKTVTKFTAKSMEFG
mmetsp:Transcript_3355/g.5603  ORF Transcript_3355/g.5603 Transcript_3355/m.5603 type:complete len:110 (+) Transcript_3355:188-517(+)